MTYLDRPAAKSKIQFQWWEVVTDFTTTVFSFPEKGMEMFYRFMPSRPRVRMATFLSALSLILLPGALAAQEQVPEEFLRGLRWQNIGPDRGGRSIGVAGSAARPRSGAGPRA